MRAAAFDVSPLYRSTVGFERLAELLDQVTRLDPVTHWPPYNIEKLDDGRYRVTMAVAGFSSDDIEVVQQECTLLVTGQGHAKQDETQVLHRGIATRAFKKSFDLADHLKVTEASLENGLLIISLTREVLETPEPRQIEIGFGPRQRENSEGEADAPEDPGRAAGRTASAAE